MSDLSAQRTGSERAVVEPASERAAAGTQAAAMLNHELTAELAELGA